MASQPLISLCIHLLGGFRISVGDVSIPTEQFRLRRSRGLLKLLALAPTHRLHRDQLVEALWPDSDPETSANSLYQAVYAARRVLADHGLPAQEALHFSEEILSLGVGMQLWVDIEAFEDAAAAARSGQDPEACRAALDLYAGDLLPEDPYEDWAAARRENLRQECQRLRLRLAALHETRKDYLEAIGVFQQVLAADPAAEEAHAGLMRLYVATGQRTAALAQYETCRQALEQELGVSPSPETMKLYQQISEGSFSTQLDRDLDLHEEAQPVPAPLGPANLPTFLIPFVGRHSLLSAIRERLLDPACRLLTLVGLGGSGKTRLSVEAVSTLAASFADGIYFVPLAGLEFPDAITPAIAQSLEYVFYDAGRDPRQQLADFLSRKKLLLVLDNFEHLLAASALQGEDGARIVAQILEAAPGVKVLVTSRARLNLLSETLLPIRGMRIPPQEPIKLEDALHYSGVRLFLEGARRVLPGFEPSGDDLEHILVICRLVEGMPLGILLAAGWLEILTPKEIAAEIRQSVDFLASRWKDLPERQRSLRAVFDHSWSYLKEDEQGVLAALSVCRGGFSAEAAREVAGAALPILAGLAGKSLVQRSPQGRYEIHELLRQYAAEHLAERSDFEQEVRDRHSRYFLHFLARREDRLVIKNERSALEEVAGEIDNLRLAWDWAVMRGMVESIDPCQAALGRYVTLKGLYLEGKELFDRAARQLREALANGEWGVDSRALRLLIARLDRQQALCNGYLGVKKDFFELNLKSLVVFQELGDLRGEADVLKEIGYIQHLPDVDPGGGFLKSIRIYNELGDPLGQARAQLNMCRIMVFEHRDPVRTKDLLLECLQVFRSLDSPSHMAETLRFLGLLQFSEGFYQAAEQNFRESSLVYQRVGAPYHIAQNSHLIGMVRFYQGKSTEANEILHECISRFLVFGPMTLLTMIYGELQDIYLMEEDDSEAARLVEEGLPYLRRTTPPDLNALTGIYDAHLALIHSHRGEIQEARHYARQALENARYADDERNILHVLRHICQVLAASGKKVLALELAEIMVSSPRSWKHEIDEVQKFIGELEAELQADIAAAARLRGRSRDLWATIEELSAEFRE